MSEKKTIGLCGEKPICGIIMPISSNDVCDEQHWIDVKKILSEAIEAAGYKPKIVSDADDSSVIQKRIIQNIYDNEIVVVSIPFFGQFISLHQI